MPDTTEETEIGKVSNENTNGYLKIKNYRYALGCAVAKTIQLPLQL